MTLSAELIGAFGALLLAAAALYQARNTREQLRLTARKDELTFLQSEVERDQQRIDELEKSNERLKRENELLRQRIELQDRVIQTWEQSQNRLIAEMRQQLSTQNRQRIEDLQRALDGVSHKLNQMELENSAMREALKQISPMLPQTRPLPALDDR